MGSPGYECEEDREDSQECRVQVISVRRTGSTVRIVWSPSYECEEDRENSEEWGAQVMSVRRIGRTVEKVRSEGFSFIQVY